MKITEKYLEALKGADDWVTISEWADLVGKKYPKLLEKANSEALNQANDTTGIREIAARISSAISRGAYVSDVEIDTSERPKKVRYLTIEEQADHVQKEIEEDTAPLKRGEIIKLAENGLTNEQKYRVEEFDNIAKQLRYFFGLNFEVDHANALLNKYEPGKHDPDNLQLLLKPHNSQKNNNNWKRFTIDEQCDYIKAAIRLQALIASRLSIDMSESVIDSLLDRLKRVF